MSRNPPPRPPLRLTGIVFAFALNLLLVSVVYLTGDAWALGAGPTLALTLIVAVVAGLATTRYVGPRSGIHAFIGGFLSSPILALFVLPPGNWPLALLAGSFCAIGGIAGEFFLRRR